MTENSRPSLGLHGLYSKTIPGVAYYTEKNLENHLSNPEITSCEYLRGHTLYSVV